MKLKLLLNALFPLVFCVTSIPSIAYDLPEELTVNNDHYSYEYEKKSLSNERLQFSSGGVLLGALAGGPLGAFAGGILGDIWGQDQEQLTQSEQQISFWKKQALESKNELALMSQKIDELSIQKVSFQQFSPASSNHLALLAWGLNSSIHFTTNSQQIEKHYLPKLKRLVYLLNQYPEVNVHLSGYSDFRGQENNNHALSLNRATAVGDYLIHSGIKPDRITIRTYGEKQPIYANEHKKDFKELMDEMALERRVDISFTQSGQSI